MSVTSGDRDPEMGLETKKKERTASRRSQTIAANRLEASLNKTGDGVSITEIKAYLLMLEEAEEKLNDVNKELRYLILETATEKEIEKECDEEDKYRCRYFKLKTMAEDILSKSECSTSNEKKIITRNFKLPVLEMRKFDGNIKNWLFFWAQFQRIDEDPQIECSDKLAYLIQAMEPGTEARNFVQNFPPTDSAYKECIQQLKARYAKDEMLIQVYVRELLSIVLTRHDDCTLSQLYDSLNAQLRALETLGVTKDKYAAFLLPMIESALPRELLRIWERSRQLVTDTATDIANLLAFLQKEVESEERIQMAKTGFHQTQTPPLLQEPTASCLLTMGSGSKLSAKCVWCDKENHTSLECFKMTNMSIDQRKEHLKKKKVCVICLKPGHHAKICKAHVKCMVCGKRHNVTMCMSNTKISTSVNLAGSDNERASASPPVTEKPAISRAEESQTALSSAQLPISSEGTTLLQTTLVTIRNGEKKTTVRALFDNGAQRSYIREDLADKLNITVVGKETLAHSLFGGVETSSKIHNIYNLQVESLDESYKFQMTALGQPCICKNIPRYSGCNKNLSEKLKKYNITLLDSDKNLTDSSIGLLIGADFSGMLMQNMVINIEDSLVAISTKVGWTLQGKIKQTALNCNYINLFCASDVITNFWSLETLGIRDPVESKTQVQKEHEMMEWFAENTKVNQEGRYEVHLPWKVGHDDLLNNKDLATRRLESVTKKFISSNTYDDYDRIFKEWLDLGIIEPVPISEVLPETETSNYLPHRPVIKESSITTRIRPVFDASAKDRHGKSLNMYLEKGVNFLDRIPKLIAGFRKGKIGVTADIAKAFLQIAVAPDDRDSLRFLWWENGELKSYRHCRLVFGLTSSPFLLSATIMSHLKGVTGELKETAQLLSQSFYVDNCITSLDTEEAAQKFETEAKVIMSQAKFDLRQWVVSPKQDNKQDDIISVLGLEWHTSGDQLGCNLNSIPPVCELDKVTKRNLLSLTQRVFDPIGFTCPVTLVPRLILQEAWRRKLTWDEDLPADLRQKFLNWYGSLFYLKDCKMPRRLATYNINEGAPQLHMFCDASKDGYAACVFLRTAKNNDIIVRLISAKSRVAPPEKISIPRLELLAALIGTRLLNEARRDLNITCSEFCWTDSGVVLCWIRRDLPWNTYVSNRVKEIRQKSNPDYWYHIPGASNWADLASRGCDAKQLQETAWWNGPAWLLQTPEDWPQSLLTADESEVSRELKKTVCINMIHTEGMTDRLNYFSKYSKIIRMVAWMLRFIKNSKQKTSKITGELSYEEYETAEKTVIMLIQSEYKESIERRISNLTHFYDRDCILKIKTKLILTDVPEATKYPAVLPAQSFIARRLVEQRHVHMQHAGANLLIADIRSKFWIIGLRQLVKSVISNCTICKRHRAKSIQAPTAPLPLERTECSAPFETTGVDLAGPLYLQGGEKCWIVLYTCAVYRAVHLELTKSLSTEAFLMTLRRFIARRGRAKLMMSDNGTNFTGTKNLLAAIDWDKVIAQSAIQRIKWKLNAPTAAWWGGYWERLIRILKDLLKRVLGRSSVGYEEMVTLLCDCEATMNSRPLTYIDENLEPLKPIHFLQPLGETDTTDLDEIDNDNLNKRLRYLQKLREDFRQRFRAEYLTTLVQKGKEKIDSLKIGDVVLIETDDKRVKWPLGIVVDIFTGRDEVSRTAKVKTSTGYKVRPFQRLYNLEVTKSESQILQQQNNTNITKTTRQGRVIKLPSRYLL